MGDSGFGNLERLMRLRDWDVAGLAAAAGVSKGEVYRLINGVRHDPRSTTVRKFADALGVSLEVITDSQMTLTQLHVALSHSALTAARTTFLSANEADRLRPLADQADAPVSAEGWAAFSRLAAALSSSDVGRPSGSRLASKKTVKPPTI